MASGIVRPGPVDWVRYAFGAGLPERHRTWVLHDVTTRTWFLRHLARAVVQLVPFTVLLWVLLGPLLGFDPPLVWAAIAAGMGMGLFYSAVFAWGATAHRAVKAGYPEAAVEAGRAANRRDAADRHR
jgi:hypothetical protein